MIYLKIIHGHKPGIPDLFFNNKGINTLRDNEKFKNFLILLNSGYIYMILMKILI